MQDCTESHESSFHSDVSQVELITTLIWCFQHCQLCEKGDNEELLLLCDGCDKGCHTYCHKPKITTIPDGDWFCPMCVAKVHQHALIHRAKTLVIYLIKSLHYYSRAKEAHSIQLL